MAREALLETDIDGVLRNSNSCYYDLDGKITALLIFSGKKSVQN
jgi:hypothetical protein